MRRNDNASPFQDLQTPAAAENAKKEDKLVMQ